MNTEFRIKKEETFSFKGGKLYLMLLIDGGRYGVEVIDREKSFGRKYAKDKDEAEELFDIITKRLNTYKELDVAESTIRSCFSKKNLNEIKFLFIVEEKMISQIAIGKLVDKFKFKVTSKLGFYGDARNKESVTIYVYFDGKLSGRFFGTRLGSDFLYESLV